MKIMLSRASSSCKKMSCYGSSSLLWNRNSCSYGSSSLLLRASGFETFTRRQGSTKNNSKGRNQGNKNKNLFKNSSLDDVRGFDVRNIVKNQKKSIASLQNDQKKNENKFKDKKDHVGKMNKEQKKGFVTAVEGEKSSGKKSKKMQEMDKKKRCEGQKKTIAFINNRKNSLGYSIHENNTKKNNVNRNVLSSEKNTGQVDSAESNAAFGTSNKKKSGLPLDAKPGASNKGSGTTTTAKSTSQNTDNTSSTTNTSTSPWDDIAKKYFREDMTRFLKDPMPPLQPGNVLLSEVAKDPKDLMSVKAMALLPIVPIGMLAMNPATAAASPLVDYCFRCSMAVSLAFSAGSIHGLDLGRYNSAGGAPLCRAVRSFASIPILMCGILGTSQTALGTASLGAGLAGMGSLYLWLGSHGLAPAWLCKPHAMLAGYLFSLLVFWTGIKQFTTQRKEAIARGDFSD